MKTRKSKSQETRRLPKIEVAGRANTVAASSIIELPAFLKDDKFMQQLGQEDVDLFPEQVDKVNTINEILEKSRLYQYQKFSDSLTAIDLSQCNIGTKEMTVVAELFNKHHLSLNNLLLADNPNIKESIKTLFIQFKSTCALRSLDIRNTGFSDGNMSSFIKSLYTLSGLTELDISQNALTESGASLFAMYLNTNTTMRCLRMHSNKLKDSGASAFAETLEKNTTLELLELDQCWIGDEGIVKLGLSIANNTTLTAISISHNMMTVPALDAFADLIKRNTILLQIHTTGSSKPAAHKLQRICKRNKEALDLPGGLEQELDRLLMQKHKLELSTDQLNGIHQDTVRVNSEADKLENDYRTERLDINNKCKKIVELLAFQRQGVEDIKNARVDLETRIENDKKKMESDLEQLEIKCRDVIRERETVEKLLEENNAKLKSLTEARDAKLKKIQEQLESVIEEKSKYEDEVREIKSKIEEISMKAIEIEHKFN